MSAQAVKDEFLKIWPLGVKCEHTHAREGFRLLDEMIAKEKEAPVPFYDNELTPEFVRDQTSRRG